MNWRALGYGYWTAAVFAALFGAIVRWHPYGTTIHAVLGAALYLPLILLIADAALFRPAYCRSRRLRLLVRELYRPTMEGSSKIGPADLQELTDRGFPCSRCRFDRLVGFEPQACPLQRRFRLAPSLAGASRATGAVGR